MKKSFEEILKELYEYAESIGMNVYFNSEAEEFRGFVIGTEDFFVDVIQGEEDLSNYDTVTGIEYRTNDDRGDLH